MTPCPCLGFSGMFNDPVGCRSSGSITGTRRIAAGQCLPTCWGLYGCAATYGCCLRWRCGELIKISRRYVADPPSSQPSRSRLVSIEAHLARRPEYRPHLTNPSTNQAGLGHALRRLLFCDGRYARYGRKEDMDCVMRAVWGMSGGFSCQRRVMQPQEPSGRKGAPEQHLRRVDDSNRQGEVY